MTKLKINVDSKVQQPFYLYLCLHQSKNILSTWFDLKDRAFCNRRHILFNLSALQPKTVFTRLFELILLLLIKTSFLLVKTLEINPLLVFQFFHFHVLKVPSTDIYQSRDLWFHPKQTNKPGPGPGPYIDWLKLSRTV